MQINEKSTQLKNLINSEKTEFLMEAHSGLSGKIFEEVGTYIDTQKVAHNLEKKPSWN